LKDPRTYARTALRIERINNNAGIEK